MPSSSNRQSINLSACAKSLEQDNGLLSAFCTTTIEGIGGMAMSERLFHFGLFEEFDNADTPQARERIYAKLLATP